MKSLTMYSFMNQLSGIITSMWYNPVFDSKKEK